MRRWKGFWMPFRGLLGLDILLPAPLAVFALDIELN
jgi:hypothetical protein